MMSDADDDALSWGDDDPSHIAAPAASRAAGTGPAPTGDAPSASSPMLVVYGVFAGIALLYVIGWAIAVQRDTFSQASLFAEVMYQLGEFLAIASPAVWMGAVLLLTRGARTVVRVAWLVVGLLLLAPWPFILGG